MKVRVVIVAPDPKKYPPRPHAAADDLVDALLEENPRRIIEQYRGEKRLSVITHQSAPRVVYDDAGRPSFPTK